ncbi:hypothetical protein ACLOJK_021965 [Asimina triloba]
MDNIHVDDMFELSDQDFMKGNAVERGGITCEILSVATVLVEEENNEDNIIVACAILNNFITLIDGLEIPRELDNDDDEEEEPVEDEQSTLIRGVSPTAQRAWKAKRDAIVQQM